MRIKLESTSPLPIVKAWFHVESISNVQELKSSLCSKLLQFCDANINHRDIILLLDDYELLDTSTIDILRDGDAVVCVSYLFSDFGLHINYLTILSVFGITQQSL